MREGASPSPTVGSATRIVGAALAAARGIRKRITLAADGGQSDARNPPVLHHRRPEAWGSHPETRCPTSHDPGVRGPSRRTAPYPLTALYIGRQSRPNERGGAASTEPHPTSDTAA